MKLRRGRRAPTWTDVPDFVTWAVDCPVARELYRLLKMHLNVERNDDLCWPTLSSLASLLNLSREDKVTPYMQKLIDAKLVDKARGAGNRNIYTVHDLPPEDYAGAMSLADWYRRRKETGEGVIPQRARRGKAASKADSAGDSPVPPNRGVQGSSRRVPPKTGVEQELLEGVLSEGNKTEDQQPPPPPPNVTPAPVQVPQKPEEEGGSKTEDDPAVHAAATEVLDRVQATGHAPRRVRGVQAVELRSLAVAALRTGWTVDDLVTAISGELTSCRSVFGTLRFRLRPENLGLPPVRAVAPVQRRPCSYGCVGASLMVGDRALACPDCKPDVHEAQRRRLADVRSVPVEEVTFEVLREAVAVLA